MEIKTVSVAANVDDKTKQARRKCQDGEMTFREREKREGWRNRDAATENRPFLEKVVKFQRHFDIFDRKGHD